MPAMRLGPALADPGRATARQAESALEGAMKPRPAIARADGPRLLREIGHGGMRIVWLAERAGDQAQRHQTLWRLTQQRDGQALLYEGEAARP